MCMRHDFVVILSVYCVTNQLHHNVSESNAFGFSAKKKWKKLAIKEMIRKCAATAGRKHSKTLGAPNKERERDYFAMRKEVLITVLKKNSRRVRHCQNSRK